MIRTGDAARGHASVPRRSAARSCTREPAGSVRSPSATPGYRPVAIDEEQPTRHCRTDRHAPSLDTSRSSVQHATGIAYAPRSSETSVAWVQTMSTLSPTFTLASAAVSCTLDVYFQPCGPVKVID